MDSTFSKPVDEKTVIVVLSVDPEISTEIRMRRANEKQKREAGIDDGGKLKLFADGTGMRFNRVQEGWVVASLSRFGRAKLSGNYYFFDSILNASR